MKDINSTEASGTLLDGRYKLLRTLSSDGGTANVWLALDTNTIDEVYDDEDDTVTSSEDTGIKVAIKIYRPKNALDLGEQRFREEFKIVFNCHHSNLVQPINFSIYEGIPYLVLPYCRNGSSESLQGKIKDHEELWKYIGDVSAGLAYLHAFHPTIVHHDIKPANILIDDNKNFAITDFGISSHRGLNRDDSDYNQSGTMAYMAPERFNDDYRSIPESDIWSFGATLYELITGNVPFGEEGGKSQLEEGSEAPALPKTIPADIRKLVADCLSLDISRRPSAEYIRQATTARQYPLKRKTKYWIAAGAVVFAAVLSVFLFLPKQEEKVFSAPISDEEKFSQAMVLVKSAEAEQLSLGMAMLDTLGNKGFIPALYEQAYIYGWYSDSASVARKRLLGIEVYPRGTDEAWLPKSHHINNKAIGLFTRIEELNDSRYPDINANALYRLACYYVNPNKVFKKNESRAEILLTQARLWAEQSGDNKLLKRIDSGLNQLKLSKD